MIDTRTHRAIYRNPTAAAFAERGAELAEAEYTQLGPEPEGVNASRGNAVFLGVGFFAAAWFIAQLVRGIVS